MKPHRWWPGFAAAVVAVIGVGLAGGAEPDSAPPSRPRIGLALGGGGGRGLAHLGILRWLEEHQVPVDFIAGTSIGGLVGGAYATGLSADSLTAVIDDLDWPLLQSSSPPYRRLIVRRKQDRRHILGGVDLSLAGGVATQSGLSAGHHINLLLSRLALDQSSVASFDDLPIPFRCVAVDLVTGSEIVLERAPLNRALRATMAIPGLFTPVSIDSMVLVDGGLVNNVPADVVRAMGAEMVIAVDVGEQLDPKEKIQSISVALRRMQVVTMNLLTKPRLEAADLVVTPDLEGYNIFSFESMDSLAARGYAAMEAVADRLEPYRLDDAAWRAHLAARSARRRKDGAGPAGSIVLRGAAAGDSLRAIREIRKQTDEGPLRVGDLEEALNDLYGWGKYDAFDYRRTSDGSGMIVETHPVAQGPPYLRLGLELDGSEPPDPEFSLKSRLTFLDRTGFGSEWRFDLDVGTRFRMAGEWYQPAAGPVFTSLRGYGARRPTAVYGEGERLAEYWRRTVGAEAAIGLEAMRRTHEMRAGYLLSDDEYSIRTGDPGLPETRGTRGELFLEWTTDSRDDPAVSYRGVRFTARGSRFLEVPDEGPLFYRAEGSMDAALPLGARQSIVLSAAGGTTFEDAAPLFLDFPLGGPFRFGALHRDEFRGSRRAYGSLGGMRRLVFGFVPLHAFLAAETGSVWEPEGAPVFRACGTLMIIAETPLGPAVVGGSAGAGRARAYFALGGMF